MLEVSSNQVPSASLASSLTYPTQLEHTINSNGLSTYLQQKLVEEENSYQVTLQKLQVSKINLRSAQNKIRNLRAASIPLSPPSSPVPERKKKS